MCFPHYHSLFSYPYIFLHEELCVEVQIKWWTFSRRHNFSATKLFHLRYAKRAINKKILTIISWGFFHLSFLLYITTYAVFYRYRSKKVYRFITYIHIFMFICLSINCRLLSQIFLICSSRIRSVSIAREGTRHWTPQ